MGGCGGSSGDSEATGASGETDPTAANTESGADSGGTIDGDGGGGTDGDSGTDGGSGGGLGLAVCETPVELAQPSGAASGFVRCANDRIQRVAAVECEPVELEACDIGEKDPECSTAADCGENQVCGVVSGGAGAFCQCQNSCAVDADCSDGFICGCSPLGAFPSCIPSSCTDTTSCGDDSLCGIGVENGGCDVRYRGACTTEADACHTNDQCDDSDCVPSAGTWSCDPGPGCK